MNSKHLSKSIYGVVIGGGDYEKETSCTIKATPNPGYEFLNWTQNGVEVSSDAEYTFIVTEDAEYVANFQFDNIMEIEEAELVIYPNPISNKCVIKSQQIVRQCDIYSITGALVYSKTVNSESFEIQMDNLPAGSYLISLISDDQVQTRRFVKN